MSISERLIIGNTLRLPVSTGGQLRADRRLADGSRTSHTADAVAGIVSFTPSETGRYYLATRNDPADDWCRAGLLVVTELTDEAYEAICSELDNMNAVLASAETLTELIQYEVATPDGTAVKRMTVRAAMNFRAVLEARKIDYERTFSRRAPVRFGA